MRSRLLLQHVAACHAGTPAIVHFDGAGTELDHTPRESIRRTNIVA